MFIVKTPDGRARNLPLVDVTNQKDIIDVSYAEALHGESPEEAEEALRQVIGIQESRKKLGKNQFASFYELFEDVTLIHRSRLSGEEKAQRIAKLVEEMAPRVARYSPRVADMYRAVLASIVGGTYVPQFELVQEKIIEMLEKGEIDLLLSPEASWDAKINCIEKGLERVLRGWRDLDAIDGNTMDDDVSEERKKKLKKLQNAPTTVQKRRTKSKPSMDEMSRLKEGERVPAHWSISPPVGGYFREQSFSVWDSENNEWIEEKDATHGKLELIEETPDQKERFNTTMTANVTRGEWVGVPVTYTHGISGIEIVDDADATYHLEIFENGDVMIMIDGEGSVDIKIKLTPHREKKYGPLDTKKITSPKMPANFLPETVAAMEGVQTEKKTKILRAWRLCSYTQGRLKYSNDSSFNTTYDNFEDGYFAGIDTHKQADCDVGNSYFAALCTQMNIPVRHVVGHSVSGKGESGGFSSINSGTGHAWTEVFDEKKKEWVRIDATSAGDRNLEDNGGPGGRRIPGDYGSQEAQRQTDEELEALRKKLADHAEKLGYTKEERYLAHATGVELKEARQIVREIQAAESVRLPNGELVVDALSRIFNAIVESRKVLGEEYSGPLRKREGGEYIEDIVRHAIGVRAGESDPVSREKPTPEEQYEPIIGGFDLYIIGDKSGSMQSTVDGESLWVIQRRAMYLILSSLYRFEKAIQRAGISRKNSLSIQTQCISFRGDGKEDIDCDKPLSDVFSPEDKVRMWHSITQQGSGNGDVTALTQILTQIRNEREKIEKKGGKDTRLRLVIACSDGGPDNPAHVRQRAEELGELNAVVVGLGLTETAQTVPMTYNTPHSHGEIVKDINDLPSVVAKYVVGEAIKLFPERARESAQQIIDASVAKFKHVNK